MTDAGKDTHEVVLETGSRIFLAVTGARQSRDSFTIEATARPNEFTRAYDLEYKAAIARWERDLADDALPSKLVKPIFGAHIFVREISISPPGTDSKLEYVQIGGTGTEWTVRWRWSIPPHIDSGRFIVSSAVGSLQICV